MPPRVLLADVALADVGEHRRRVALGRIAVAATAAGAQADRRRRAGPARRVTFPNRVTVPSGTSSDTLFGRASPPPASPHGAFFVRSTVEVSQASSRIVKSMSSPSPPRCRPGPHESGASSKRSISHGFLASQTSIGVMRVAASETCIRLLAPSPPACAPWPTGCGAPSVHGSPVPSRSPHQTRAQMSPPLQAGTASGSASATAR